MLSNNCVAVSVGIIGRVDIAVLCVVKENAIFTLNCNTDILASVDVAVMWLFAVCYEKPFAIFILTELINKVI